MIAWAWHEYMNLDPTHNPEWLPRLPMTKAPPPSPRVCSAQRGAWRAAQRAACSCSCSCSCSCCCAVSLSRGPRPKWRASGGKPGLG